MKYRAVGQSEIMVPELSIGALHFGVYLDEKESIALLSYAYENGINFFDCGPLYGNGVSELIVGKFIKSKRDKIIVTTKVGLKKIARADKTFGVTVEQLTRNNIVSSLERSLKRLGIDYIDIFQLHAFDSTTPLDLTLETLEELIKSGKIRNYGVSNFDENEFDMLQQRINANNYKGLCCIESHYNVIERMIEKTLLPKIIKEGIGLMPYRALARGLLSDKYLLNTIPSGSRASDSWRVRNTLTQDNIILLKALSKMSRENYRLSLAQLSVHWLLNCSCVSSVIVGCRDIPQLEELITGLSYARSPMLSADVDLLIKDLNLTEFVLSKPEIYFER